jgi:SAM-dependent methyltransferase
VNELSYVTDWSPVSDPRYEEAQGKEREYWSSQDREVLTLSAKYYFYAGHYEWTENRGLLNPFRADPSRPANFQISSEAMEGSTVLDIGCGPTSPSLSLVHCATVHVLDPLVDLYRELQPFGWEFFGSVSATGAEQLPFDSESFHFVHCSNALDHVQDADAVLREIARVLLPGGLLLFECHTRGAVGAGKAHPYLWSVEALEGRLLADYAPVEEPTVVERVGGPPSSRDGQDRVLSWVGCLRPRAGIS